MYGGDSRKVANEIGMSSKDAVVIFSRLGQFFDRLRQALNVRGKHLQTLGQSFVLFRQTMNVSGQQLQALRQSAVPLRQPIQAFVRGHIHILPLFDSSDTRFSRRLPWHDQRLNHEATNNTCDMKPSPDFSRYNNHCWQNAYDRSCNCL
jgi:hypothetical protein